MPVSIGIPVFRFALRDGLDEQFLPTRAHEIDTGWDVRCAEPQGVLLSPGQYTKISLGFRAFPPPGWWCELKPRSSTFAKKRLHSLYGTIDEGFENEWMFACQYIPSFAEQEDQCFIDFGERIGQIIPVRREIMIVESVTNEELDQLYAERAGVRGTGGFGSTGN